MFFFIGRIVKTQDVVEMLPSWIPFRLILVYLIGALELGVALRYLLKDFS